MFKFTRVFVSLFVLILFFGCDSEPKVSVKNVSLPKTSEEKIMAKHTRMPKLPVVPATLVGRVKYQKDMKKISLEAMLPFYAIPEVTKYYYLFESKSYNSIPVGPVITQTVFSEEEGTLMNQKDSFEVVYMPLEFKGHYRSLVSVNNRTMRIFGDFRTREWLGIILYHELVHIEDNFNGTKYTVAYEEEVKPHLLENHLIKSWNPKGYSQMIMRASKYLKDKGLSSDEVTRSDIKQLALIAADYYPVKPGDLSESESALAVAACVVAILFETSKKQDSKSLANVYKNIKEVM